MEKLAGQSPVGKNAPATSSAGQADAMPPEYWEAVLRDAGADARQAGRPIQSRTLAEIGRHVSRVSCSRCGRIVEIQTVDAVRLYGRDAVWKDVGQRILDATCQQRTGSHEDDGCWPSFG
ncbi:hypothetical protein AB8Z38_21195 [Bradyrhizobium sp. LLZ17]|uniref:Transposase n=1 Tax=Bradyrhizobium sp. LLZ17 TaxID=3239388 RepID=A0AB39XD65_9BRAD